MNREPQESTLRVRLKSRIAVPQANDWPFDEDVALDLYKWAMEYTHRMWTYFQALAVGAAAFAWTGTEPRDTLLLIAMSVGLLIFGVANGSLVVHYQRLACAAVVFIEHNNMAEVPGQGSQNLKTNRQAKIDSLLDPSTPKEALLLYSVLLLVTILAIWIRTFI